MIFETRTERYMICMKLKDKREMKLPQPTAYLINRIANVSQPSESKIEQVGMRGSWQAGKVCADPALILGW